MTENCLEECRQWQQNQNQLQLQFQRFPITDSQKDDLYDIVAYNATGDEIRLEKFEGYVSFITSMIYQSHY